VLPPEGHDRSAQEALQAARVVGLSVRHGPALVARPRRHGSGPAREMGQNQPLAANIAFACIRTRFTREQSVALSLRRCPAVGRSWGSDMGWRVALHRHAHRHDRVSDLVAAVVHHVSPHNAI
jgi:hypothetical protein